MSAAGPRACAACLACTAVGRAHARPLLLGAAVSTSRRALMHAHPRVLQVLGRRRRKRGLVSLLCLHISHAQLLPAGRVELLGRVQSRARRDVGLPRGAARAALAAAAAARAAPAAAAAAGTARAAATAGGRHLGQSCLRWQPAFHCRHSGEHNFHWCAATAGCARRRCARTTPDAAPRPPSRRPPLAPLQPPLYDNPISGLAECGSYLPSIDPYYSLE